MISFILTKYRTVVVTIMSDLVSLHQGDKVEGIELCEPHKNTGIRTSLVPFISETVAMLQV